MRLRCDAEDATCDAGEGDRGCSDFNAAQVMRNLAFSEQQLERFRSTCVALWGDEMLDVSIIPIGHPKGGYGEASNRQRAAV